MTPALLRRERQALAMPRGLLILQVALDGVERAACAPRRAARAVAIMPRELGQLALARQHAVQFAVGRKEQHRCAR